MCILPEKRSVGLGHIAGQKSLGGKGGHHNWGQGGPEGLAYAMPEHRVGQNTDGLEIKLRCKLNLPRSYDRRL